MNRFCLKLQEKEVETLKLYTDCVDFLQDEDSVRVTLKDRETGAVSSVRANCLIAAMEQEALSEIELMFQYLDKAQ